MTEHNRLTIRTSTSKYQWPDRETWAKQRRTAYADMLDDLPVSRRLSDYATAEEIETAIEALEALYREEGRRMRAAKIAAGPLGREPDETDTAYSRRFLAMPGEDRAKAVAPIEHQDNRHRIKHDALAMLRRNRVPHWLGLPERAKAILAAIHERYSSALSAAEDAEIARIESLPIDDEAWGKELQRRDEIENSD